ANQVKFTHAHQIAKNTCKNGTTVASAWPSPIACENSRASAATEITNVRSNSSSSWLDTRCGSSLARALMRVRAGTLGSGREGEAGAMDFVGEQLLERAELAGLRGGEEAVEEALVGAGVDREVPLAGELAARAGDDLADVGLAEPEHLGDPPVPV